MEPGKFSKVSDTSRKAEEVQINLLRKLTPGQRAAKAFSLSRQVIELSKRAIRRRNPGLSKFDLEILSLRLFYGPEIAHRVREQLEKKQENGNR